MNTDEQYGTLQCAGNTGWMLSGPQPFKFIAAEGMDVDSTVVEITAMEGSGISSSIGIETTDTPPEGAGRLTGSLIASEPTVSVNKNTTNKEQRDGTLLLKKLQLRLKKENALKGNKNQRERLSNLIEKLKDLAADKKELAKTGTTPSFSTAELRDIAINASINTTCNPSDEVTIEKEECVQPPSVPRCSEPTIKIPEIIIKVNPNGFENENITNCETKKDVFGFFKPSSNKFFNPYIVDVCFNESTKSWNFNFSKIEVNTIISMCMERLSHYKVINSEEEAEKISFKICAYRDFNDMFGYPVITSNGGYIIYDALIEHEYVHKTDFQEDLMKASDILDELLKINPECQNYPDITAAEKHIKYMIDIILRFFKEDAVSYYSSRTKEPKREGKTEEELIALDEAVERKYESSTQESARVKIIIQNYIRKLGFIPTGKCLN